MIFLKNKLRLHTEETTVQHPATQQLWKIWNVNWFVCHSLWLWSGILLAGAVKEGKGKKVAVWWWTGHVEWNQTPQWGTKFRLLVTQSPVTGRGWNCLIKDSWFVSASAEWAALSHHGAWSVVGHGFQSYMTFTTSLVSCDLHHNKLVWHSHVKVHQLYVFLFFLSRFPTAVHWALIFIIIFCF